MFDLVLIIAEGGVNHNGSLSMAKELVKAAKMCGADIIKFQFFEGNNLVTPSTEKAKNLLGYEAKTTIEEMLDVVIPWIVDAKERSLFN